MLSFIKWLSSILGVIFLTLLVLAFFVQNDLDEQIDVVQENKKVENEIRTGKENLKNDLTKKSDRKNFQELDLIQKLRPNIQREFLNTVIRAQKSARLAKNDLQKGGIKAARNENICVLLSSLKVQNWTGQVATLSSNSAGKGVLSVKLDTDIFVSTWNNAVSDFLDNTLLEPKSSTFNAASKLEKNQQVLFSGEFLSSSTDCITEKSMTLKSKILKPNFLFRFSNIASLKQ